MICYFCNRPIIGKAERHHRTPRRYIKRGYADATDNVVLAHSECHRRLHKEYDDSHWKLSEFRKAMEPINYGEGIFA
jgi:5-methylcytosine-specific restriction endonuclease McrA